VTLDEQIPMGEQRSALRGEPLFGASCLLGRWRARAPSTQFRLLGRETLPRAGHRTQHRFDHISHDRERTELMPDAAKNLRQGRRLEG